MLEASKGQPEVSTEDLVRGRALQMDHYQGKPLDYGHVAGSGLMQTLVELDGESTGRLRQVLDASGGYASACLGSGYPLFSQIYPELLARVGQATDEIGSAERSRFLNAFFGPEGHWSDQFPAGGFTVSGRSSGSEGMELALRLVLEQRWDYQRMAPRPGWENRTAILAFEGAWHGWTPGVQALVNRRHFRVGLPDALAGGPHGMTVRFLPFGVPDLLEDFFKDQGENLAAVVVEPIQGDAGILVPPEGYLRCLAEMCRRHGALLVADEVLTFGKTGRFFAMHDSHGPIHADITVIGKSLGFGLEALSLVIARADMSVRSSGAVATRDLRPLTCGLVHRGLVEIMEKGYLSSSAELGQVMGAGLADLARRFPDFFTEARGIGYLHGLELTQRATEALPRFRRILMDQGIFVEFMAGAGRRSHGQRFLFPALRVAPPLIAGAGDLSRIHEAIEAAARRLRKETE